MHFSRSFIGEGYRENGIAGDTAVNKVSNAMGNSLCLPRPSPGNNKKGAFGVEDSLFLLRIKCV